MASDSICLSLKTTSTSVVVIDDPSGTELWDSQPESRGACGNAGVIVFCSCTKNSASLFFRPWIRADVSWIIFEASPGPSSASWYLFAAAWTVCIGSYKNGAFSLGEWPPRRGTYIAVGGHIPWVCLTYASNMKEHSSLRRWPCRALATKVRRRPAAGSDICSSVYVHVIMCTPLLHAHTAIAYARWSHWVCRGTQRELLLLLRFGWWRTTVRQADKETNRPKLYYNMMTGVNFSLGVMQLLTYNAHEKIEPSTYTSYIIHFFCWMAASTQPRTGSREARSFWWCPARRSSVRGGFHLLITMLETQLSSVISAFNCHLLA